MLRLGLQLVCFALCALTLCAATQEGGASASISSDSSTPASQCRYGTTSDGTCADAPVLPFNRFDNAGFRLTADEFNSLHHLRNADFTASSIALLNQIQQEAMRDRALSVGLRHHIRCEREHDCRGVFATANIHAGETVLNIPRALFLDSSVTHLSEWTAKARASYKPDNDLLWMSVFLLYDYKRPNAFRGDQPVNYGPESPWKRYYDTLPKDFPNHPLFFDLNDSREDYHVWLRGSPALNDVLLLSEALETEYNELADVLENQGFKILFTKSQWMWARTVVHTRAFYINAPGALSLAEGSATTTSPGSSSSSSSSTTTPYALIPFADLLNHASVGANAEWSFDVARDAFVLVANRNITNGEEILIDYYGATTSNSYLFTRYGFVNRDNPNTEAVLSLTIPIAPTVEGQDNSAAAQAKWSQERVLKSVFAEANRWVRKEDLNALVRPSAATIQETESASTLPYLTYLCSMSPSVHVEYFSTCHAFARYAVTNVDELMDVFTARLPNVFTPSRTQTPLSWNNEIRALNFLKNAASKQLQYYDTPYRIDEASLLSTHQQAQLEGGKCNENVPELGEGCLSSNQIHMLLVRMGEKALLNTHLAIVEILETFIKNQPTMLGQIQPIDGWLQIHLPDAIANPNKLSNLYFKHVFVPLFIKHQGWDESDATETANEAASTPVSRL